MALRMICDREEEINAFIPEEYWNLEADLFQEGGKKRLTAKFHGSKEGKMVRNLVKTDPVNFLVLFLTFLIQFQSFHQMPGNGLPLAVGVRGQIDHVGFFQRPVPGRVSDTAPGTGTWGTYYSDNRSLLRKKAVKRSQYGKIKNPGYLRGR